MHEVVIISGKGGAGKTSVTGAFAAVARDTIVCDLDVDAPDLHLLLRPKVLSEEQFLSGNEAIIDQDACTLCGQCYDMCRFDAVELSDGQYRVAPYRCEGCKVCVTFCPAGAIDFPQKHCGQWMVSETRFGTMVHAQLFPGEENSGRLVTLLKQKARAIAEEQDKKIILSDGAPGIGCPVISSLAGTDLAVVVTEPTLSGQHDLERVAELCTGFKTQVAVLINKWDINPDLATSIEKHCFERGYTVLDRLPHDQVFTEAMVAGKVLPEYQQGKLAGLLENAWTQVVDLLHGRAGKSTYNLTNGV